MAITLDELLGRDRGSAADTFDTDRFPSYGEFTARRSQSDAVNYDSADGYGYDYDLARRAPSAPRSAEAAREYEPQETIPLPSARTGHTRPKETVHTAAGRADFTSSPATTRSALPARSSMKGCPPPAQRRTT